MMKLLICGATALVLAGGITLYTAVMARTGSGTPPEMSTASEQTDEVLVIKSTRELFLKRDGETLRHYQVSLGARPSGHKVREGDERTPEGTYVIDWRNARSVAYLSLHISYPNDTDTAAASAENASPGGNIMIHGQPNGWGLLGCLHLLRDCTDGCIAVTNAQMRDICSHVPDGTPITSVDTL